MAAVMIIALAIACASCGLLVLAGSRTLRPPEIVAAPKPPAPPSDGGSIGQVFLAWWLG